MRCVSAVRPGDHVSTEPCRTTRTGVTAGTAIHYATTNSYVRSYIAYTVLHAWTLALRPGELALEKLTAPADGAKRISLDNVQRPAGGVNVSSAASNLFRQRLVYSCVDRIQSLSVVDHLPAGDGHSQQAYGREHYPPYRVHPCQLSFFGYRRFLHNSSLEACARRP